MMPGIPPRYRVPKVIPGLGGAVPRSLRMHLNNKESRMIAGSNLAAGEDDKNSCGDGDDRSQGLE